MTYRTPTALEAQAAVEALHPAMPLDEYTALMDRKVDAALKAWDFTLATVGKGARGTAMLAAIKAAETVK